MRLAVFSDIHGNYQALKAIMSDIDLENIDRTICLGDTIGLGPSSNECLRLLNSSDVKQIVGNHELYYTKGIDKYKENEPNEIEHNNWIHSIISEEVNDKVMFYEIEINKIKLLFIHYFLSNKPYPYEDVNIFETGRYKYIMSNLKYDYVFYGHLHEERIDNINNSVFYSVQSSGCTKGDETCYYIIDVKDKVSVEKKTIKYNREEFEIILRSHDYPDRNHIAEKFFNIKI